MNNPRPSRPPGAAPVRSPVRSAQRPQVAREEAWLARAWATHPLVAMVRHRRRLSFFQGLHGMLRAGIPLNVAFTELSRGSASHPFYRAVAEVGAAVASGSGLAAAMRRAPAWFESQTVDLLEAAEVTGTLEGALARIIERLEASQRLRMQAAVFCIYPGYLVGAFIFGGALLDTASTAMATGKSDALLAVFLGHLLRNVLLVAGLGLGAFAAPLVLAAPALAPLWARVRMRVPLLGRVHAQLQASRFCDVLGFSLGAGLEVVRGLRMALDATGSPVLRARAGLAAHRLQGGATLTDVVEWLGVLDGESLRRLSTGERTGYLAPTLAELAREHAESGMRWLRTLVFVLLGLLVVVLIATNLGKVVGLQGGYLRELESLGKE